MRGLLCCMHGAYVTPFCPSCVASQCSTVSAGRQGLSPGGGSVQVVAHCGAQLFPRWLTDPAMADG